VTSSRRWTERYAVITGVDERPKTTEIRSIEHQRPIDSADFATFTGQYPSVLAGLLLELGALEASGGIGRVGIHQAMQSA
jgi:hypothetical protein